MTTRDGDVVRHWLAEHRRVRARRPSRRVFVRVVRSCRSFGRSVGRTDAARGGGLGARRSVAVVGKPAREEDRIATGFACASRARSEGGVRARYVWEVCARRACVERDGRGAPSAA